MKTLCALFLVLFAWTSSAFAAKTVLISDIDDTVKISYSFGIARGLQFMRDTESRFTGMSDLYGMLTRDNTDMRVYYVSMAPTFLMKTTHLEFLKNGRFPQGLYLGRDSILSDDHKLEAIRSVLRQEKPERVIMVGDDGQEDAAIYHAISIDPEFAGVTFDQFIHVVSSSMNNYGQGKIYPEQVGFVTSVDLAAHMQLRGLIEEKTLSYMMGWILPKVLTEKPGQAECVEEAFPYFMNCRAISWKLNIPGLNERVKSVCSLP